MRNKTATPFVAGANTVMKFVEASTFGGPEVLKVVESQTPSPREGTLLVEIRAAGVNYADIMARSGFYPRVPKAPFPVGFEIAGVVKGMGKGVEGLKEGDSVAAITQGGGYATHAVVPAMTAIPLPAGFDHALAVAVFVQGVTAYILLEEARVKAGETVLISAAGGGLGNIAVQLARARGAKVVMRLFQ
jgi:NADPH:quinone reductase